MRLLHIDTGREMRGGQRQVLLLTRGLQASGHSCILLARPRHPLWEAARSEGYNLFPANLYQLWRRSSDVDLVHAHDARAHSLAAIAARRSFVVSRRVSFPVQAGPLSAWKYRRARRFQAVSNFVARQLEAGGVPSALIDVVPDAVEDVVRPARLWDPSYPVVTPASADPLKGNALSAHAARLAGVELVFSHDLARDLERASLFLYVTGSEGFGSAVLLAMRMGVPVIASRVGGLPEVIEDGVSGLLVENDPETLARAITRLKNDSELAGRLIGCARQRVEQQFTLSRLLANTLASYQRALAP